jgi:3-hydroxyacyl-[acyl-carrier-protein] dehydratase
MTSESTKTKTDTVDLARIMRMIPHRYPFLLVDRVERIQKHESAVGIKNVTFNEPHFQGHFPGNPVMPGVLMCEALAQLGGIVTSEVDGPRDKPRMGFLAGIDKVRFRRMVTPGDVLKLEVEVIAFRRLIGKIKGVASVDGETAVEAEVTFVLEPLEEE